MGAHHFYNVVLAGCAKTFLKVCFLCEHSSAHIVKDGGCLQYLIDISGDFFPPFDYLILITCNLKSLATSLQSHNSNICEADLINGGKHFLAHFCLLIWLSKYRKKKFPEEKDLM